MKKNFIYEKFKRFFEAKDLIFDEKMMLKFMMQIYANGLEEEAASAGKKIDFWPIYVCLIMI